MSKISFVAVAVCALALSSSAYGQCCDSGTVVYTSPVVYHSPVYSPMNYWTSDQVVTSPWVSTRRLGPSRWFSQRPVMFHAPVVQWSSPVIWQDPIVEQTVYVDECGCQIAYIDNFDNSIQIEEPVVVDDFTSQTIESTYVVTPATNSDQIVESPIESLESTEAVDTNPALQDTEIVDDSQALEVDNSADEVSDEVSDDEVSDDEISADESVEESDEIDN